MNIQSFKFADIKREVVNDYNWVSPLILMQN